jgi:branched-chain amino acid transport system permease protein
MNFNPATLLVATLGLLLAVWPLAAPGAYLYLQVFGLACFYGILAMAWNIFALTGSISLGHAAFFGLGAYGSALFCQHLHWSPFVTAPLGALVGAAYGLLWCLVLHRLRGAYLGLATLAAMEIPKVIVDNWDGLTSGSLGIVGIPPLPDLRLGSLVLAPGTDLRAQYYLLLLLLFLAWLLHRWVIHSRWGWGLRAIRENEAAAAALGVEVNRSRFQALLLSAYLTGLCGGIYAHLMGLIEPTLVFSLHLSALPLVLSIFGGRYQICGPILGALLLYPLDQLVLQPWLPTGHAAIYGLMIILTILFFPGGLAAWLTKPQQPA